MKGCKDDYYQITKGKYQEIGRGRKRMVSCEWK